MSTCYYGCSFNAFYCGWYFTKEDIGIEQQLYEIVNNNIK